MRAITLGARKYTKISNSIKIVFLWPHYWHISPGVCTKSQCRLWAEATNHPTPSWQTTAAYFLVTLYCTQPTGPASSALLRAPHCRVWARRPDWGCVPLTAKGSQTGHNRAALRLLLTGPASRSTALAGTSHGPVGGGVWSILSQGMEANIPICHQD